MGTMVCGVASYGALTNIETMKAEEFFLKNAILLRRNLWHEKLLGVSGVARVLVAILDDCHPLVELFLSDAERPAKVECVKVLHLAHDHHDVVGRLIIYQQLTITVIDDATSRENDVVEEGIVISTGFVFPVRELEKSQSCDVA